MADGILGLGSSGSTGLSQELIDKLKDAEAVSKIQPYEDDLENWDLELEKITEIESKVAELLNIVQNFDLYSSTANSFEQVSATTTGSSAIFDAYDVAGLEEGSNSITITQLAQRDVYQTDVFSDSDDLVAGGQDSGDKITITVGGTAYDFSTEGKTYAELAQEINANDKIVASVEQVSDTESRIVIKSKDSGTANALTLTQSGVDLGLSDSSKSSRFSDNGDTKDDLIDAGQAVDDKVTINGIDFFTQGKSYQDLADAINAHADFNATIVDGDFISIEHASGDPLVISTTDMNLSFSDSNHLLQAQNLQAQIDGVDYDVASNTITIQGNLSMTAVELGTSTISIQKDNSQILPNVQELVTKYNELNDIINNELYSAQSPIEDTSSLRMIMDGIKDKLFGSYGASGDKNLFNYGFSTDLNGVLSVDTEIFSEALTNDPDGIKELFIGTAEDPGFGTVLKEYLDDLDSYDGLLTLYGDNMSDRKIDLETDLATAQEALDTKYDLMAQQFAAYTAIITQMEAAFGGMKMMIEQSTASN
jgi:flagellar hook-associated protein 2